MSTTSTYSPTGPGSSRAPSAKSPGGSSGTRSAPSDPSAPAKSGANEKTLSLPGAPARWRSAERRGSRGRPWGLGGGGGGIPPAPPAAAAGGGPGPTAEPPEGPSGPSACTATPTVLVVGSGSAGTARYGIRGPGA